MRCYVVRVNYKKSAHLCLSSQLFFALLFYRRNSRGVVTLSLQSLWFIFPFLSFGSDWTGLVCIVVLTSSFFLSLLPYFCIYTIEEIFGKALDRIVRRPWSCD